MDAHLVEVTIARHELLKGHFLHAYRDEVLLPDGSAGFREYIVHPGAVMVIPMLLDDTGSMRLVMERQYRYPVKQVMIEFPAGKLDPGETSRACAERELLEETGYSALEWVRVGRIHPAISYSTEFIDIWFARCLTSGPRRLDAGEFLDVFTVSAKELMQWCRSGKVTDAKTLAGVFWLQGLLDGKLTLDWESAL
jgi:ADP-ribose pyrophosphatase